MSKNISDSNYEIAHVTDIEKSIILKAENLVKEETGKDFILIAWEKDINLN